MPRRLDGGGWEIADLGRRDPPLRRCSSWPTATTGTRGYRTSRASSAASRSTRTPTRPPSRWSCATSGSWWWASATAPPTSPASCRRRRWQPGGAVHPLGRLGGAQVRLRAAQRPGGQDAALRPAELAAAAGARAAARCSRAGWRTTGCRPPTTTSSRPTRPCPASCCCGWARATPAPSPTSPALDGATVHFTDGSSEEFDAIVYATGYNITFPFFDEAFLSAPGQPPAAVQARVQAGHRRPGVRRLRPGAAHAVPVRGVAGAAGRPGT